MTKRGKKAGEPQKKTKIDELSLKVFLSKHQQRMSGFLNINNPGQFSMKFFYNEVTPVAKNPK